MTANCTRQRALKATYLPHNAKGLACLARTPEWGGGLSLPVGLCAPTREQLHSDCWLDIVAAGPVSVCGC